MQHSRSRGARSVRRPSHPSSRDAAARGAAEECVGGAAGPTSNLARDDNDDDGDDDSDTTDDSAVDAAEPSVFFKQEATPEYLVCKLNDYAMQGKLRFARAVQLIDSVRASLSEIDTLLLAYRPPLASRAAEWRHKRALFKAALAGASPAVDIGKLIPFKL